MEIKAAKIFTIWQDGVKVGELSLEERKISLFVEPETVRHGKWKAIQCPFDTCSECGESFDTTMGNFNFCPNCGAKMDSEVEE